MRGPGSWLALNSKVILTRARPPEGQQWAQLFLGESFTRPELTQPLKGSGRGEVQPQALSPKQLSISSRMIAIYTFRR